MILNWPTRRITSCDLAGLKSREGLVPSLVLFSEQRVKVSWPSAPVNHVTVDQVCVDFVVNMSTIGEAHHLSLKLLGNLHWSLPRNGTGGKLLLAG